ncbi:hypothetical protein ACQ4PT_013993 [Festuca glaucescens]
MAAATKPPLKSSSSHNSAAGASAGKTIEEMYQKRTQLEHILLRPDTYVGSIEKHKQEALGVRGRRHGCTGRSSTSPASTRSSTRSSSTPPTTSSATPPWTPSGSPSTSRVAAVSVYNNGDGVPIEIHQEEGIYVPELIFGHLLTSSNYNDDERKTTGGRNGYGAKLTNIFSTGRKTVCSTRQFLSGNMGNKSKPEITKCKQSENWTRVTFKPDLEKFNMTELEKDVVALMKKRVVDMAGTLGKTVKVELNGQKVPVKCFSEYVQLYIDSANKEGMELPRVSQKVNDRWEVCVSLSEGQFQQVSFVNGIATTKGGTHVDYVANQIASHVIDAVHKKNKNANMKLHTVKGHLWVFVNALIDNPAFDSQTKETLTTRQGSFGSKCDLSLDFLKKVANSGVVENLLSWADFKLKKDLKKTDGTKRSNILGIPKLDDANDAGGKDSDKCTLILTEGDSAKALAMAGVVMVSRDRYGVFPLRGKLLNVREASAKQLTENAEIQNIKKILGLQHGKHYDSTNGLRYGHLMIMTDQDHDDSHIEGLLINFIHSFWPSLLKVPSFLVEFITPIIKGLGTSTADEGRQYFKDIAKHKKDFVWADDHDGKAIEMAFSKKEINERKNWLSNFQPGTCLDQREKHIKYSDFINKELILFSMADLERSIPSMVDGLKPGQRKILFCSFKRNLVKEAKVAQFIGYVSEHSAYHHGIRWKRRDARENNRKKKEAESKAAPKRQPKKTAVKSEKVAGSDDEDYGAPMPKPAAQKKKPAKKASAPVKEEEEEMLELKDRLAAYSINDSSLELSAMDTETTEGQQKGKKGRNVPTKRGAAKKAMASLIELSDEDIAVPTDESEDEEFAMTTEAPVEKKARGRKPAAEKPAAEKPKTTAARKRAPAPSKGMRQKVLEETFKPVDDSNSSAPSPEKKVRKIRASPFNKKSSSILQRASTSTEDADAPPSGSSAEPVAPRRTVRERKTTLTYVESESEDKDSDDEDVLDVSDDSEYSDDD